MASDEIMIDDNLRVEVELDDSDSDAAIDIDHWCDSLLCHEMKRIEADVAPHRKQHVSEQYERYINKLRRLAKIGATKVRKNRKRVQAEAAGMLRAMADSIEKGPQS